MSDIEGHLDAHEGCTIDKYRVIRKLGTGTFGRVFLCAPTASIPALPKQGRARKRQLAKLRLALRS